MADDDDEHLKEVTEKLKQGLEVKDRRYRLKVYKQVFLGTDAVNFFLAEKYATNIADAVALGSELMAAGVFQHCLRDHPFKNEPLFYCFVDQDVFHGGYELGKTVLQMSCKRVGCERPEALQLVLHVTLYSIPMKACVAFILAHTYAVEGRPQALVAGQHELLTETRCMQDPYVRGRQKFELG